MKKILRIGILYPRTVIALIALISIIASFNLTSLRVEITAEGMMLDGDPERQFYQETLETFGTDNVTIIYIEDKNLFQYDKLKVAERVVNTLNNSNLIDHTVSLFSTRHIRTIDGFTYTSPYLKDLPKSSEKLREIQLSASNNPLVQGNILSKDGKTMAVNIYFDSSKYYRGFDKEADKIITQQIKILEKHFETVFYMGDPYVREGINQRIKNDQLSIVPLAIIILVITLAISLRRFQAALLPIITAGLSIVWLLSFMVLLDIPVNIMTSIIPALLIIIGSTEDIHLLTEFNSALYHKKDKRKALDIMTNNMGIAVVLTFVTTYLGFLSISLSDLGLLKQFGLIASAGLLFNFIITILLIPAVLSLSTKQLNFNARDANITWFQKIASHLSQYSINNKKKMLLLIVSLLLVSVYYAKQVNINNNVMDYFDENELVTQYANKLHENLTGIQTFSIIMTGNEGTFIQVPYLHEIWDLQSYLKDTRYFDNSYSFADFIAVIHTGLESEKNSTLFLPERSEIVNEYVSLLERSTISSFISEDFSQARIFVRHNISSSEKLNEVIKELNAYVDTWADPNITIKVTGESYLNSKAIDYMVEGQFYSLLLIFSVIFFIVSFLFMNWKAGLIAVISNIFPIIILFGVMGFMNIPMNIGTAMIAAISLGVCVDYTMHFMVRYHRLSRLLNNQKVALFSTVREEAVPIISTVLSLAAGFFALSLSDFPPVTYFGQLSALVMILALFTTFVITVMLLDNSRLITVWDVLNIDVQSNIIENCPLFREMKVWQVRKIIAISEIREFKADQTIVLQDKIIKNMYVVLDGAIESWRKRSDGSVYSTGITSYGGVFGMMFPDSGRKCSANMIAMSPTKVLVLKWDHLIQMNKLFPRLSNKLYKNVSRITSEMLKSYERRRDELTDELSGAYNAGIYKQMLKSYIVRAVRYDENFTIINVNIVDSDESTISFTSIEFNLKLRFLVKTIEMALRTPDIIGRWNNNTLSIALPMTNIKEGEVVVGRIYQLLEQNNILSFEGCDIEVNHLSLEDEESYDNFIKRSDLVD